MKYLGSSSKMIKLAALVGMASSVLISASAEHHATAGNYGNEDVNHKVADDEHDRSALLANNKDKEHPNAASDGGLRGVFHQGHGDEQVDSKTSMTMTGSVLDSSTGDGDFAQRLALKMKDNEQAPHQDSRLQDFEGQARVLPVNLEGGSLRAIEQSQNTEPSKKQRDLMADRTQSEATRETSKFRSQPELKASGNAVTAQSMAKKAPRLDGAEDPAQALRAGGTSSSKKAPDHRDLGAVLDPAAVCDGSIFDPDPTKYYTIAAGDKYWAQGSPAGLYQARQNTPRMSMYMTSNKVISSSHWRFIPSGQQWKIQNRLTGLQVWQFDLTDVLKTHLSGADCYATCSSSKQDVKIEISGDFVRCYNGCGLNDNLVRCERPRHEKMSTGCESSSSCPSGWTQTDSTDYFFCTDRDCDRYTDIESQKNVQYWSISEVDEFVRPDIANAVTVTVEEHALETLGNQISLVADIGFSEVPLAGELFSFAQSEYFSGPSIAEQLQTLADDVQKMTADMISTGIVSNSIDDVNKELAARRKYFLNEYPGHKKVYIQNGDYTKLDGLARDLVDKASEYLTDMETYFGTDYFPTPMNVKRAQKGFQYMKFAMVEVLTMYQEGVLLNAYTQNLPSYPHTKYDCPDLVNRYLIPGGESRASVFKIQLQKTLNMLKSHREGLINASYDQSGCPRGESLCNQHAWVHDDLNGHTELFYYYGFHNERVFSSTAQPVANRAKSELNYDMEHWSYPIKKQVKYFDGFDKRSLQMCYAVRSDAAFKTKFEQYVLDKELKTDGTQYVIQSAAHDTYIRGWPNEGKVGREKQVDQAPHAFSYEKFVFERVGTGADNYYIKSVAFGTYISCKEPNTVEMSTSKTVGEQHIIKLNGPTSYSGRHSYYISCFGAEGRYIQAYKYGTSVFQQTFVGSWERFYINEV